MRASILLATALASAMLASSGQFNPADARMTLSQCISKRSDCRGACIRANGPPGKLNPVTLQSQYCKNRCEGNHAACVDFVMSMNSTLDPGRGPSRPPRRDAVAPTGGILEPSQGFNPQGPAATGSPLGGGGGGRPAPPAQIR